MSEPAAPRWLRSSAARERRAAEGRPPLADFWSRPRRVWLTLALSTLAAVASIVAGCGVGVLATLPLLMAKSRPFCCLSYTYLLAKICILGFLGIVTSWVVIFALDCLLLQDRWLAGWCALTLGLLMYFAAIWLSYALPV